MKTIIKTRNINTAITANSIRNNIGVYKSRFVVKSATTSLSMVVPKKVSDLKNDKGFITKPEIEQNLVNVIPITALDALDDWANL